jgi:hypothetical protein
MKNFGTFLFTCACAYTVARMKQGFEFKFAAHALVKITDRMARFVAHTKYRTPPGPMGVHTIYLYIYICAMPIFGAFSGFSGQTCVDYSVFACQLVTSRS